MNYDEDKMARVFHTARKAQRGTDLHNLAKEAIRLRVRMPDDGATINAYVNDAIGFLMTPEQRLFYSRHCFGTADALGFRNNKLRVHDLKTGTNPATMKQLEIYAALFCHEYGYRPSDIEMELRVYQNDSVEAYIPDPGDIWVIMKQIEFLSKHLDWLLEEVTG